MAKKTRPSKLVARRPVEPAPATAWNKSDSAIERDLLTGANIGDLQRIFSPAGYRELRDLAKEAQSRSLRGGRRVLILPGIMGSKLGIPLGLFNDVLWFNPVEVAAGRLADLKLNGPGPKYKPVGVLLFAYLKLKLTLRIAGFNADFHPYDWRLGVAASGQALADRILAEGRPVDLVAHSMGGLVARAALTRGLKDVGKVIMLGTPNYGSFAPVQVLRGTYDTVVAIAKLDLAHNVVELVDQCFNTFPGLYEMLPGPEQCANIDFFAPASWPAAAPHADADLLKAARDAQSRMAAGDARFFLIAGVNRETVVGARAGAGGEFTYDLSLEGDGTVPLAFARLKGIPEGQIYYVEEAHGSLPNNGQVEQAVHDLLGTGSTGVLKTTPPPMQRALRSATEADLARESERAAAAAALDARYALQSVAAPLELCRPAPTAAAAVMQPAAAAAGATPSAAPAVGFQSLVVGRRRQRRLDLRVCAGSITQVESRAWVLGLFRNVAPSGAAAAIDRRLGGAIAEFAARRMFSGDTGEIFSLPVGRNALRADMVVFAGLGPFDGFSPQVLSTASENIVRVLVRTRVHEFATVIIGAGSGFSIGRLLEASLAGYFRALKDADSSGSFRAITICETDPARLAEIKAELFRLSSTALFDDIEVSLDEIAAEFPDEAVATRGPQAPEPAYLLVRSEQDSGTVSYRVSVLSASARASLVSETASLPEAELDSMLARLDAIDSVDELAQFGRELAQKVVPEPVATELLQEADHRLVVVHDAEASKIPWETLRFADWAPAEQAGLSHRLDVDRLPLATWSERRRQSAQISILLVVDPSGNLPGAVEEGARITDLASRDSRIALTKLVQGEATRAALLRAFRSGQYDIVHYAGHAGFDKSDPGRLGLLCADGILHGGDLAGMTQLPGVVFLNACESARARAAADNAPPPPPRAEMVRRSFSVAETLLRGGVANFLGTYWSVADDAAKEFSSKLYAGLLAGDCLGDAIQKGRAAVRDIKSRDWADYVFYGSYDFALKTP